MQKVSTGLQDVLEMTQWRKAHPKATLREIEEVVDAQMNQLRAQLIQELVHMGEVGEWSEEPPEARPKCERCGTVLVSRGKQTRWLQTNDRVRRPGHWETRDQTPVQDKSVSLATRLIQAGQCFHLVEAIPEQVVRLFLRNVRVNYIRHHIGCGDELAPLQVPEVDILRALLQASSRRQDRNALELIVRQVRKNGVHALELIGRECTR